MTTAINFTKAKLAELPVPLKGKRAYYKDSQVKGLYFVLYPSGSKSFYVIKKIAGRPEQIFLGKYPDLSVENARKLANVTLGQIAMGINPQEEKRSIRKDMTLGELFTQYMERYSKPHKISWKEDETEIPRFFSHWFKRKISTIKKKEIQRLHETVCQKNGSSQANKVLQRVRAMYNKAIEWDWPGINPTNGIKKYREKSRDRFILPVELPCIFKAIDEEKSQMVKDYFTMLLLTGARRTNTAMMRVEQINFEFSEWRIPDSKNGDPIIIPLMPRAIEILQRRVKKLQSSWVFPRERDPEKHFADAKQTWKRIVKRAAIHFWRQDERVLHWLKKTEQELLGYTGLAKFNQIVKRAAIEQIQLPTGVLDIRPHDLRRTFGSYQAINGTSLQIIGKSLGHRSTQSTEIYARLNLDPVRASIEAATNVMFQLQSA